MDRRVASSVLSSCNGSAVLGTVDEIGGGSEERSEEGDGIDALTASQVESERVVEESEADRREATAATE